jgi:hypothetical protein
MVYQLQEIKLNLDKIDLRHHWNVMIALGSTVLLTSIPIMSAPFFFTGLGLALLGTAEMASRPKRHFLSTISARTSSRYPWKPTLEGVALYLLGGPLFAWGVHILFAAA